MDSKVDGSPKHFALVLMLLGIHWSLVLPAPTNSGCAFCNHADGVNLLLHETKNLLGAYEEVFQPLRPPVLEVVPSAYIKGSNFTEKLRDIYTKCLLFQSHLEQAEQYIRDLQGESVLGKLEGPKMRLSFLLNTVEEDIKRMPLPTTPAPLSLPFVNSYSKKVYAWGVIVRLMAWEEEVHRVLEEECGSDTCPLRS